MSKKEKQKEILMKIDALSKKTQKICALVPLSGDPVPGHTWKEFDEAYQANKEIAILMDQLRDSR